MKARLYRLYNYTSGNFGEPMALCDKHAPVMRDRVAEYCWMKKIADRAVDPCAECNNEDLIVDHDRNG